MKKLFICIGCGHVHTGERYMVCIEPMEWKGICEKCISYCVASIARRNRIQREIDKTPLTLKVIGE